MRRVRDDQVQAAATPALHCEVRLLGGVELLAGGHPVTLTPDARRLLGLLALRANRLVPPPQLSDFGDPPQAELTAAFVSCGSPGALRARRGGQLLHLAARQIDAAHFERLAARATVRMTAGDLASASRLFGGALELWPVTPDAAGRPSPAVPLAGMGVDPTGWAAGEIARLTGLRAEAAADNWECELRRAAVAYRAAGGPIADRRVVTAGISAVEVAARARIELAAAVAADPTRARLWELLLVAAFLAAGRRAAAEVASRAGGAVLAGSAVPGAPADAGQRLRELAEAAQRGDLVESWAPPVPAGPGPALSGPGGCGPPGLGAGGTRAEIGADRVGGRPADGRRAVRRSAGSRAPLPVPLTELVGRDALLIAVERLLAGRRLVTLTGPGGSGKTRLAIGVARRFGGAGAGFVDLTVVDDDAGVPETVAAALGVSVRAGDPGLADRIAADLAGDAVLLVLDNCEHVVDGCTALVARLLDRCPRLRVLATSRITLRLPAEALVPVPPLASPPVEPGHSLAGLARHPATRLFLDRARARRGRPVPAGAADAVARLCAELDGLPLAIELAAAWAATLSVEEIAARTAADPTLLRSPDPTAPSRHRTLAGAIETSVARLDDEARLLFEWLAAFPGGFDAEAAAAVRGPTGPTALAALVDASLVAAADGADPAPPGPSRRPGGDRPSGRVRYRMLAPIRRHALARLIAGGAETAARRAEARYVLALAERADHLLTATSADGPPPGVATDQQPPLGVTPGELPVGIAPGQPATGGIADQALVWLRPELPNVRSAMRWLSDRAADGDDDLRLAVALATYCEQDRRYREGLDWLVGALARHPDAPETLRVRAVTAAGRLTRLLEGAAAASGTRQRTGPPPNTRRPARPANGPADRPAANGPGERQPANVPGERRPATAPGWTAGPAQPMTAAGSAMQAVPTRRKPARR